MVRTLDFITTSLLDDSYATPRTLLAETHQPVLIELVREECVLFIGQSTQFSAESVVPLFPTPLEGTKDLPFALINDAFQQRYDRLPAHEVPAWHLGHPLL